MTEATFRESLAPMAAPTPGAAGGMPSDLQSMLDFIDKVIPRIESFMTQVARARGIDASAASHETPREEPMQNTGAARLAPVPVIDAVAVYNKLLGALNSLDQGMTVGEALEKAKQAKGILLPLISSEIDALFKGDS